MKTYPLIRVNSASGTERSMLTMNWTERTIPIQTDGQQAGCHGCLQSDAGPSCHSLDAAPSAPPRLVGPTAELRRIMAALAPRLGFDLLGGNAAGSNMVRGLAVSPGEVTLELAVGRQCSSQGLIDTAFQTLRTLLPDTDIYVTHAA